MPPSVLLTRSPEVAENFNFTLWPCASSKVKCSDAKTAGCTISAIASAPPVNFGVESHHCEMLLLTVPRMRPNALLPPVPAVCCVKTMYLLSSGPVATEPPAATISDVLTEALTSKMPASLASLIAA
jgi:hypothetical protein